MFMLEPSNRQQFLGMSKRSFSITLAILLLGLLVGASIEAFQWPSAVDFFKGAGLLKMGREHQRALSWIRFCAYAGMLACMAFGFAKWLSHGANSHRDDTE